MFDTGQDVNYLGNPDRRSVCFDLYLQSLNSFPLRQASIMSAKSIVHAAEDERAGQSEDTLATRQLGFLDAQPVHERALT